MRSESSRTQKAPERTIPSTGDVPNGSIQRQRAEEWLPGAGLGSRRDGKRLPMSVGIAFVQEVLEMF